MRRQKTPKQTYARAAAPTSAGERRATLWTSLAIFGLLACYVALGLSAACDKALTGDEGPHLAGGVSYWAFNDYRIQPNNGNWPQRLCGLPVWLLGYRFPSLDAARLARAAAMGHRRPVRLPVRQRRRRPTVSRPRDDGFVRRDIGPLGVPVVEVVVWSAGGSAEPCAVCLFARDAHAWVSDDFRHGGCAVLHGCGRVSVAAAASRYGAYALSKLVGVIGPVLIKILRSGDHASRPGAGGRSTLEPCPANDWATSRPRDSRSRATTGGHCQPAFDLGVRCGAIDLGLAWIPLWDDQSCACRAGRADTLERCRDQLAAG